MEFSQFIKLIKYSVIFKCCLSIITYILTMLGLSAAISDCSFMLLIILYLVYTAANSEYKGWFVVKLGQRLFILCVIWGVFYEIWDVLTFSFFDENIFILFIGNYILMGIEDIDLSAIESLKKTIYTLFKDTCGGTGGGGGPDLDFLALYYLNLDTITDLDLGSEPEVDLYPNSNTIGQYTITASIDKIENLNNSYSYLHNFKDCNLTKEVSAMGKSHNLSLIKPNLYEMIREKKFSL